VSGRDGESAVTAAGATSPGIYIHIPYCRSKCGYCAFNSRPLPPEGPPPGYIEVLRRHLAMVGERPWSRERVFGTVYFGGGTPTVYGADALLEVLASCRQAFRIAADAEISMEANPNTVSLEKLSALRRGGVNRLSLGVQSFADSELRAMGRSHDASEAAAAVDLARAAGFTNFSLDLIYGLPGQTAEGFVDTVRRAMGYAPPHLSLYALTLEEGTPLADRHAAGQLDLPDEDALLAMEDAAYALLASSGLARYEIASFARPGFACRHNCNYWHNGDYVGIGAGAVSCFSGLRVKNIDNPEDYVVAVAQGVSPQAEEERLPPEASFRESVVMGLRMISGIEARALEARYGRSLGEVYGDGVERLIAAGWLEMEAGRLRLSAKALPVANQILSELV